jgi:hypothetical protein
MSTPSCYVMLFERCLPRAAMSCYTSVVYPELLCHVMRVDGMSTPSCYVMFCEPLSSARSHLTDEGWKRQLAEHFTPVMRDKVYLFTFYVLHTEVAYRRGMCVIAIGVNIWNMSYTFLGKKGSSVPYLSVRQSHSSTSKFLFVWAIICYPLKIV